MLPLWPFRRRDIRHRTFGKLRSVRNGQFWKARVAFEPEQDEVEVHINAGESGPTDAQEKLYLLLKAHSRKVMPAALKALHGEYQRVTKAQPQIKWPHVATPADLLRVAPLDRIWLDDGHGHRFVLSFQADADKDQEFHVFFKHWKVESVASER